MDFGMSSISKTVVKKRQFGEYDIVSKNLIRLLLNMALSALSHKFILYNNTKQVQALTTNKSNDVLRAKKGNQKLKVLVIKLTTKIYIESLARKKFVRPVKR